MNQAKRKSHSSLGSRRSCAVCRFYGLKPYGAESHTRDQSDRSSELANIGLSSFLSDGGREPAASATVRHYFTEPLSEFGVETRIEDEEYLQGLVAL